MDNNYAELEKRVAELEKAVDIFKECILGLSKCDGKLAEQVKQLVENQNRLGDALARLARHMSE